MVELQVTYPQKIIGGACRERSDAVIPPQRARPNPLASVTKALPVSTSIETRSLRAAVPPWYEVTRGIRKRKQLAENAQALGL